MLYNKGFHSTKMSLSHTRFLGGQSPSGRDAVGASGGTTKSLPAVHGGSSDPQPGADIESAPYRMRSRATQGDSAYIFFLSMFSHLLGDIYLLSVSGVCGDLLSHHVKPH